MEFNPRICITGSFTLISFARSLRLSLPMDGMKHSIARDPVDRLSIPRGAPKIDPPGLRRLRFSFHKPHCQRAGTSPNSQDQTSGLRSEKKNHTRFPCWALPSIRNCCRPVGWRTLSFSFQPQALTVSGWRRVFRVSTRLFKQQTRSGVNKLSRIFYDSGGFSRSCSINN